MADTKISSLTELTSLAPDDELVVVDKSDTAMAGSGTDKRVKFSYLTQGNMAVINVKDPAYGATGDGTTDDTTALAAALAAVPTNGALYFPPGTYITGQLTNKSNLTLLGYGATIKRKSGVTGALFTASVLTRFTCRGLTFDNLAGVFGSPIFDFTGGSSYIEIAGNRFTNFNSHVIRAVGGTAHTHYRVTDNIFLSNAVSNTLTTDLADVSWCWFERNYVSNTGMFKDEASNAGTGIMHHIFVRDNLVRNADASCTLIRNADNDRTIEDVVVSGNQGYSIGSTTYTKGLVTVGENTDSADTAARARRITVSNNIVKDHYGAGIVIGGGPNPGVMEDVTITGNVIDGTNTSDAVDTARSSIGISTWNTWRLAISGNSIRGCGESGIRVVSVSGAASDVTITGNHVSLCAQNPDVATALNEGGILTYGTVKDVTIVGNVCIDSGSEAGQGCAGINSSLHVQTGHVIVGNRCGDTRGTPFQDYGIAIGEPGADGSQPTNFTVTGNDVRGNVTGGVKVWASVYKNHNIFNNMGATSPKGTIVAYDGTYLRELAVGANGQVLTADSTATAGVKWATP